MMAHTKMHILQSVVGQDQVPDRNVREGSRPGFPEAGFKRSCKPRGPEERPGRGHHADAQSSTPLSELPQCRSSF